MIHPPISRPIRAGMPHPRPATVYPAAQADRCDRDGSRPPRAKLPMGSSALDDARAAWKIPAYKPWGSTLSGEHSSGFQPCRFRLLRWRLWSLKSALVVPPQGTSALPCALVTVPMALSHPRALLVAYPEAITPAGPPRNAGAPMTPPAASPDPVPFPAPPLPRLPPLGGSRLALARRRRRLRPAKMVKLITVASIGLCQRTACFARP
jgi:hypothetical protein